MPCTGALQQSIAQEVLSWHCSALRSDHVQHLVFDDHVAMTSPPRGTMNEQPADRAQSADSSPGHLSVGKRRGDVDSKTGVVKRAMEGAADKLNRGISVVSGAQLSQSQPVLPTSGSRRLFGRSKEAYTPDHAGGGVGDVSSSTLEIPSSRRGNAGRRSDDDSPFITPRSPPFGAFRPDFAFRGTGSIRLGTQALIQALQAIPWGDDADNDDDALHGLPPQDTDSEEDDQPMGRLASSIHTLYRPLARLKRSEAPELRPAQSSTMPSILDRDETWHAEQVFSDEDVEEDFEDQPGQAEDDSRITDGPESIEPQSDLDASITDISRAHPGRSGSMATVKVQRRAKLAEKLREVFELDGIQEVVAEIPCWLLRSILLQGYMYLTDTYLCFFAHMPSKEDQVLKSGYLSKRATRSRRWIRHWFVLKNDALSWYQSSSDPYFPHGIVDLRYAITCEPIGEKVIRLRTNQKSIRLSVDSVPSRDEWVKAIRKVMFKAQNMGDSVKIAIPYTVIVDVDRSAAMDFSDTIEVKVVDKSDGLSLDSYFFAYFQDIQAGLEQIRDAVRACRGLPEDVAPPAVIDTTTSRSPHTPSRPDDTRTSSAQTSPRPPTSTFKLPSIWAPLRESLPITRSTSTPVQRSEEFTHVAKKGNSSLVTTTLSPPASPGCLPPEAGSLPSSSLTLSASGSEHTYPPSLTPSHSMVDYLSSAPSTWSVGVPSWLRMPSRSMFTGAFNVARPTGQHAATMPSQLTAEEVSEVYTTSLSHHQDFGNFSILDAPESMVDTHALENFRSTFAFDDKENLLGSFTGYIFRMLPIYGRLYVSTNYFCFKSTVLATRTTMILPIRDILSTEKSKAFRFGHHGLVIMVKGHEELFFEFSDPQRREALVNMLSKQTEDIRRRGPSADGNLAEHEALILDEFGPRKIASSQASQESISDASGSGSVPAVMFNSASSTFLTFKPKESLHFTFLTIGSRGDVQPYIALAKGLMADGHRVRIATHGEFKTWVESHGIEFGYVGGDPAELMRLCVENGTFTVSFLREGLLKFREWIDDLLKTSWEACQGTDVLIESPSAMAGYHIAEALRIPYFRAFTMTWTRTRAYPHAFAVPENKMGGNYNYMSYVLFEQVFWRGISGQINRWRRNVLGLPATGLDKMETHKIPFLYNFSPSIVPPPLDWPDWIRVTGYWFLNDADVSGKKWTPPPDLVEFIETAHKANKKVVYIGFGSVVVPDPKVMTRCVIEAVQRSGVYCILSKGWSDRLVKKATAVGEPEDPLPPQIYPIQAIPHDWLFQRIDAACHHGGAGTTGASLRAGIPTIIKPFFGDQFFWGDRVEALGIGTAVRNLTVEALTDALVKASADLKQIQRAKEVGEQIRSEDGVATAIEAIYRDMEYARSLIKGGPPRDSDLDPENATIREAQLGSHPTSPEPSAVRSGNSSPTSDVHGPSSDWSVISDRSDISPTDAQ